MAISEASEGPSPHIRYRRALHLRTALRELWLARHVVSGLTERDLRSRYSQMALGILWSVLGPLALMVMIVFVLNKTNLEAPYDVPRPIFTYLALIPWGFFQGAVSSGGSSLVTNNQLLNKVYVPREVFPISQILTQTVNTAFASTVLVVLFVAYGFAPKATSYWAPIPILIAVMFTAAVTILISGLTVYFRDLRQGIPVVLQLGLFFNPIAYDLSQISETWQPLYVAVNPLAAAIDGLRQCMLYGEPPRLGLTLVGGVVALVELVIAYVVFKQMEAGFADVA